MNLSTQPIYLHKNYLSLIKASLLLYITIHFGFIFFNLKDFLPQTSQILILMIFTTCILTVFNSYLLLIYIPLSFLFFFNNLYIYGINHDYIGLAILVYLLLLQSNKEIGSGQKLYLMPNTLYHGLWFFFSISYFCSAINKILITDFWRSADKFSLFIKNSPVFNSFSLLQNVYLQYIIYGISLIFLMVELLFFISFFVNRLKKYFFALSLAVHLGILFLTKMSEISLSVLLMHLFLFNSDWIKREKIN